MWNVNELDVGVWNSNFESVCVKQWRNTTLNITINLFCFHVRAVFPQNIPDSIFVLFVALHSNTGPNRTCAVALYPLMQSLWEHVINDCLIFLFLFLFTQSVCQLYTVWTFLDKWDNRNVLYSSGVTKCWECFSFSCKVFSLCKCKLLVKRALLNFSIFLTLYHHPLFILFLCFTSHLKCELCCYNLISWMNTNVGQLVCLRLDNAYWPLLNFTYCFKCWCFWVKFAYKIFLGHLIMWLRVW